MLISKQGENQSGINLFDTKYQFDNLIRDYENVGRRLSHLHHNGNIVNNPLFESDMIKIQGNQEHEHRPDENRAVARYLKPPIIQATPQHH